MFILQETPIDLVFARHICQDVANGALVSFEGIVRPDSYQNSTVEKLLYIADTLAVNTEGTQIIHETLAQFRITRAVCIQRVGLVGVNETAVWIGTAAAHRDEAFSACRYVIEAIKKRLLIWKKEFYSDGKKVWIRGQ